MPLEPKKPSKRSSLQSTKPQKHYPLIKQAVLEYGTDVEGLYSLEVLNVPFGIGNITLYHNPKLDSLVYNQIDKRGRQVSRCDEGTKRVIYNCIKEQIADMPPSERKLKYNRKTVTIAYIDQELKRMESFKRKGDAWYMKQAFLSSVRKHLEADKTIDNYEIAMLFDYATQEFVGFYETNIDPFPESVKEAHVKIQRLLKIY